MVLVNMADFNLKRTENKKWKRKERPHKSSAVRRAQLTETGAQCGRYEEGRCREVHSFSCCCLPLSAVLCSSSSSNISGLFYFFFFFVFSLWAACIERALSLLSRVDPSFSCSNTMEMLMPPTWQRSVRPFVRHNSCRGVIFSRWRPP